jgi:L-aminopeptidase/D-esterase-like protein
VTPVDRLPEGVRVGHHTDAARATGCTIFLLEPAAPAGLFRYGISTATRHVDGFGAPGHARPIDGILLTGGSAFGLAAANGPMTWLRERGVGVPTGGGPIPRVPAAVIHDLAIGPADAWPDAVAARQACLDASQELPAEGSVGVGTGATVGKALGVAHACKGGFGRATARVDDAWLGAFVVANPFGDLRDPASGEVLAGCHQVRDGAVEWLGPGAYEAQAAALRRVSADSNTTLVVLITDAALAPRELDYLAMVASQGLTTTLAPAQTPFDGDLVFAVSVGAEAADPIRLGYRAPALVERAMSRAIDTASSLGGVPAARELRARR